MKRISLVINNLLPNIDFEILQKSELGESRVSQGLESYYLSNQTSHNTTFLEKANSQSSHISSQDISLDTSLS